MPAVPPDTGSSDAAPERVSATTSDRSGGAAGGWARTVALKDGSPALLRDAVAGDAPAVLALELAVHEDGRGVVMTSGELRDRVDGTSPAIDPQEGVRLLLALPDGTLLGNGDIRRRAPFASLRHAVGVGLAVDPRHQGLGAGRLIMEGLVARARTMVDPPVTRIELRVLADNDRAIPLYASLGFTLEGTHRNFLRRPDGSYVDDHSMALLLDEAD